MGTFQRILLALLLICAGGAACVSGKLRSPAQGGRPWTLIETEHFRLYTDLDAGEATAIVKRLEADLQAISQAAFKSSSAMLAPTEIVIFAKSAHFHNFASASVRGSFYRGLPIRTPGSTHLAVTYGGLDETTRITLMHELVHDVFARNFGPAPPWLSEGQAQFYSTVRVEGDQLRVGEPLPNLTFTDERAPFVATVGGVSIVAIPVESVLPPSALLALGSEEFYRFSNRREPTPEETLEESGRYLGAWALLHMLIDGNNQYSKRYSQFQEDVLTSSVEDAWRRAFAGVDPLKLDRDFQRYLSERRLTVYSLPYNAPPEAKVRRARALSDGEIHTLWARLHIAHHFYTNDSLEHARAELGAALENDASLAEPSFYRALLARHQGHLDEALKEIERARSLKPDDGRFLLTWLQLRIERAGGELSPAEALPLRQSVDHLERVADSPQALLFVAHYSLAFGDTEKALALGARALSMSPVDSFILADYAALLEQAGELDAAIEKQRAAIAFLNEDQGARAHLSRDLERMKASRTMAARAANR